MTTASLAPQQLKEQTPETRLLNPNARTTPFDPVLAAKVREREALFLQQLHYWHVVHREQDRLDGTPDKHVRVDDEGAQREWHYETLAGWLGQFPGWTKSKLTTVIRHLKDQGLIVTGRFNKFKSDQTTWYAVHYENYYKLMGSYSPDDADADVANDVIDDSDHFSEIGNQSSCW